MTITPTMHMVWLKAPETVRLLEHLVARREELISGIKSAAYNEQPGRLAYAAAQISLLDSIVRYVREELPDDKPPIT